MTRSFGIASSRARAGGTWALTYWPLVLLIVTVGCGGGGGGIVVRDPERVVSVTVTPPTASVEIGKTVTLSVSVVVENGAGTGVTWVSSDLTRATVAQSANGAIVTGVAAGAVTITAKSTADTTKRGTAEVTVTVPPPPPAIAVTVSQQALTVAAGASSSPTTVTVARTSFTGPVDLTTEGLPTGVTATLNPARLAEGVTTSALTLIANAATAAGSTPVTVRAKGQGVSDVTATIQLTILRTDPRLVTVSAGDGHSCALSTGGQAYCWGANGNGQLGDGSTVSRRTPRAVAGGRVFSSITAGDRHTCAIEVGGQGYCWGLNEDGQLGTAAAGDKNSPTQIAGGRTYTAMSAGRGFSCAVATGGQAYCWGLNTDGQVGDGSKTARPQPQAVAGGLTFTAISANTRFACGIVTGGAAYCWGVNTQGQLGDGTNQPRVQPTVVADGLSFNSIATGEKHACATTPGGGGYCWGDNAEGALGSGNTTNSSRPVALPSDRAVFTSITGGLGHTCATSTGGQGYCWGLNNLGQVGDNTIGTNRTRPVALDGGRTFINISAGNGHTCGVTNDNQVYCWGSNVNGQLGDGTTADKQIPFPVSFAGATVASRR